VARRLLVGLFIGLLVGAIFAFALIRGLQMTRFEGAVLAYLFASLTGAVTGLVAGKPIWSTGAQIEAALKAIFGGLAAAGLMFVLQKWGPTDSLNLSAIGGGGGSGIALWRAPGNSLPIIAALLGAFFGLDNTGDGEAKKSEAKGEKASAKRGAANAAPAGTKARVATEAAVPDEEESGLASRRAKR
jgi:hypothetical protein